MPEFPKHRSAELSKETLCQFLEAGAGLMMGAAVNALIWQQYWATIGTSLVGIGFEAYAAINGCNFNPEDPEPYVPTGQCRNCCSNAGGDGGDVVAYANGNKYPQAKNGYTSVSKVEGPFTGPDPNTNYWSYKACRGESCTNFSIPLPKEMGKPCVCIENIAGGNCEDDDKDDPKTPGYEFEDPNTGCRWTVYVVDAFIGPGGLPVLRYRASSDNPSLCGPDYEWWYYPDGDVEPIVPDPPVAPEPTPAPTERPDGGPPPSGDDPYDDPLPPIPAPTDPPAPPLDCCNAVLVAVGQLKNAVGVIDTNLRNHMINMAQIRVADLEKDEFTAACDKDDDGELLTKDFQFLGGQGLFPLLHNLKVNQNELQKLLQQHLEWKTPICVEKEETKGEFSRTLHFVSDTRTDNGNRCQDKQFQYHSNKQADHPQLVDHWKDFTWTTGPVIVRHRGSEMGRIAVWAKDMEEGLRVLNHAADEAGVDLNEKGSFETATVSNSRYGQSRLVRIKCVRGVLAITSRQGSDGYPEGG